MLIRPGDRFGRLVAREAINRSRRIEWRCDCDCGGSRIVRPSKLLSGRVTSCDRCAHIRHGQAKLGAHSPEYDAWINIKTRLRSNKDYCGRITICERWLSFENFFADMGRRPSPYHSLERIDNDGPYAKWNCKWATKEEQQNNRRVCRYIVVNGVRLTIAQWSRKTGLSKSGITKRLDNGWDPAAAVTTPAGEA